MVQAVRSYRPTRVHIAVASGLVVLLIVVAVAIYYVNSPAAGLHARLGVKNSEHIHVNEAIPVKFDRPVDLAKVDVALDPATDFTVTKQPSSLVITPKSEWQTTKRYTIRLKDVPDQKHEVDLKSWSASFFTQPRVGVSSISVDGKAQDPKAVQVTSRSKVQVAFTIPMKTSTVSFMLGDQALPGDSVQWQSDSQSATLTVPVKTLYAPVNLTVGPNAQSTYGDPFTDPAAATLTGVALEPANTTSGIDANFKPAAPTLIVVENSDASRPQHGLQTADMVYEYVSEYNISRMTAIYFNKPPDLVGPVRSCRMINPFLGFAFDGHTMCSGASVGTLHYMFLDQPQWVPGTINDFDTGSHFFRSGVDGKVAPHNLYTTGDRALTLRQQWPLAPPTFGVDPPHPDIEAGDPADAPQVPLHHVSWAYDPGSKQYLRTDTGQPFVDASTGQQLHAKNVVLLHVGFHDAGWVEDDNGGAHSIWYDMLGTGPAEIYSDGRVIHATWHMGPPQGGTSFFDNHNPVWFTDPAGNVVELNSGLTWLHVLGNGQNS